MLDKDYGGVGQTIQLHPNTTYENLVVGLAYKGTRILTPAQYLEGTEADQTWPI